VRYTIGPAYDADGERHEAEEAEVIAFLEGFWPQAFDELESIVEAAD